MAKSEAAAAPSKPSNGNGNGHKVDSEGRKLYSISTTVDGERYVRDVPLVGIPFWVPQKRTEQPPIIAGIVEEIVTIPANEEAGFLARQGILLKTRDTMWVVPAGAAIERQLKELNLGAGQKILIEFAGVSRKSKPGRNPALRMNISVYDGMGQQAVKTITTA